MMAGESRHKAEILSMQNKLQFDDPINIQFTSVSVHDKLYKHF